MRNKGTHQKSEVWPFWVLLVVTITVIAVVNLADFSLSAPGLLKASGGLPLLDTRLWYTPADAYKLFDALGAAGRANNRLFYLTFDIVIPLSYSLFLWSAISRGAFQKLRGLGLLGGAFDYLENIAILILLLRYPEHLDNIVTVAACFTLLKFAFCAIALVLAVAGFLIKSFRRQSVRAIQNKGN